VGSVEKPADGPGEIERLSRGQRTGHEGAHRFDALPPNVEMAGDSAVHRAYFQQ
jgi:hypothetical protein